MPLFPPASTALDWIKPVGADPTGSQDSTAALQAAFSAVPASGGVVYVPQGTYKISSALTASNNTIIQGDGPHATVISQTSTTANAVTATTPSNLAIRDLSLQGPNSGSGNGINFTDNAGAGVSQLVTLQNVGVNQFGGHGVYVETPIVTTLSKVNVSNCGGNGFYLNTNGTGGTSVTFASCYASGCAQAGYYLFKQHYSGLSGCATDHCGIGYYLDTTQAVSLNGCGCESTVNNSSTYNGTAYKLTGGNTVTLSSCYNFANAGIAVWLTSGQNQTVINEFRETNPTGSATASIQADAGCAGVLLEACKLTTVTNLAAGTADLLPANAQGPADQNLIAWNYDPVAASGSAVPASGVIQLVRIVLREPATITNVLLHVGVAGTGFTSGDQFAGLYTAAGSRVGVTADQTTNWGSTGLQTMPLTAPYAAAAGTYYVAFVQTGSANVAFARSTGIASTSAMANAGLTAATARFATNGTSQTTLPSSITMSANVLATVTFWAAVS